MDVKTPREINLAMLSLIKLFKDVRMEKKSITLNPKPRLPSGINDRNTQQVLLPVAPPVPKHLAPFATFLRSLADCEHGLDGKLCNPVGVHMK